MASTFRIQSHKIPTAYIREYPRATSTHQEERLQLAIKQYTPLESPPANCRPEHAITLIGAHANGFPKELYEPLWEDLLPLLRERGVWIRGIWIADVAHQGESGVLNEDLLGNDPSWADHPRDLFLMINHFAPQMQRPLIGIGHSMGGNNLVNLSLMHPRLLTSLILIDPVIQRIPSPKGNFGPAKASTGRRDLWPSRHAAREKLLQSKFYQAWDPRVLGMWVQFGLRELPTPLHSLPAENQTPLPVVSADTPGTTEPQRKEIPVTLATTKAQEVRTFLRPNFPTPLYPYPNTRSNPLTHPDVDPSANPNAPFYSPVPVSTFHNLPKVRPSVFYIFADSEAGGALSEPVLKADKLANTGVGVGGSGGVKAGRVSSVTFDGVGHLIPMEAVGRTAKAVAGWITPEVQRWAGIEAQERREWASVPERGKKVLSEEYVRTMRGDWMEDPVNKLVEPEKAKSRL